MRLRGLQLDYRVREVYETYEAFKSMVSGGNKADVEDMTDEEASKFFASLRDTVDIENLKIGGHSFGGGTTFRVLQTAPPEGYDVLPIKHAVSLDPWLEPFPFVDERPTTNTSYPPNLSINSQEYTEWEPHFSKVTAMCKEMEASFVSITGLTRELLLGLADSKMRDSRTSQSSRRSSQAGHSECCIPATNSLCHCSTARWTAASSWRGTSRMVAW